MARKTSVQFRKTGQVTCAGSTYFLWRSRIKLAPMNATSRAIIETVLSSDNSLTLPERAAIRQLLAGGAIEPQSPSGAYLMTQKQAAEKLGVNRVTLWRLTQREIFHLVEITPGTWRYRFDEIQAYAHLGFRSVETNAPLAA